MAGSSSDLNGNGKFTAGNTANVAGRTVNTAQRSLCVMSLVVLAWCSHTYFCDWGEHTRDIVVFWDYEFTVRTEGTQLAKYNEGINQILEPQQPHKRTHSSFGLGSADGVSKTTAITYGVLLPVLVLWFAFFLHLGRQRVRT